MVSNEKIKCFDFDKWFNEWANNFIKTMTGEEVNIQQKLKENPYCELRLYQYALWKLYKDCSNHYEKQFIKEADGE